MQIQTAQIIQRAFRRYLYMLFSMSTRIKRWYTKLKLMEDFKVRLFYFRAAYRIQRFFRGYASRMVAAHKRRERDSTSLVQRTGRAWNVRRQRSLAIRLYHKMFFRAAIVIQCLVRRVISIKRTQLQLLLELVREEDRMEKEEGVVEEAIKVAIKKTRLYMGTDAGTSIYI